MPSVSSRGGRQRRTVNEINMVPFIDVMLVLLVIFMVTAPMLTPGAINVPSAGKASRPPTENLARILIDKDGSIRLKTGSSEQVVLLNELGFAAKAWQAQQPEDSAVVISADKTLSYDTVMQTMGQLQRAGVKRVALDVKSSQ
ncbi:ExbD/TolR family protein [Comamonas endophytica]|uniref:ExbD/TolR family protein n=1 Tax=Comamonas endophytica TaxID=2949090 RepID=A0ABY6G7U0_9BURK|nr:MULTISPECIES: ExbD/TolR family protein [unclassified Acidovorax]MCD2514515.1 ExbD/TolR family protein [Acidovorax sp. D4N7]UYG51095.1 ExbD/TolR family protein [Acidovorax sp. 5MLIR]